MKYLMLLKDKRIIMFILLCCVIWFIMYCAINANNKKKERLRHYQGKYYEMFPQATKNYYMICNELGFVSVVYFNELGVFESVKTNDLGNYISCPEVTKE